MSPALWWTVAITARICLKPEFWISPATCRGQRGDLVSGLQSTTDLSTGQREVGLSHQTIDRDPQQLVRDRVHGHHGEVLGEGPQRVVVRLRDPVGPVEDLESLRHRLVRVEVGVEKVEDLGVPGLVHDPEDDITEVLRSSYGECSGGDGSHARQQLVVSGRPGVLQPTEDPSDTSARFFLAVWELCQIFVNLSIFGY